MRIGELARRCGVTVRTVRYYIEEGLLPPPPRRGKYGEFDEGYVSRLLLILRLKEERLSLRAIRERLAEIGLAQEEPAGEDSGRLFRSRFAQEAGLSGEQVGLLEEMGLWEANGGLLPAEALPLARAVADLFQRGATPEDLSRILGAVQYEIGLHRRLLTQSAEDAAARFLRWQEQVGAVAAIRQALIQRAGRSILEEA